MKTILTSVLVMLLSMSLSAQNYSDDVRLISDDGSNITVVATATAEKKKDAEDLALKSAFNCLFHTGIEGLKSGVAIVSAPRKDYDYRFYNEKRYINYIVGSPKTTETKKISKMTRASVMLTINLKALKADLIRNQLALNPGWSDAKAVNATAALNPTIVVVPMMRADEGYSFGAMRTKIENSRLAQFVVKKVSEGFRHNGFKTRDFITQLQNAKTDQVLRDGAQADDATMVVQQLPGDIVVTVDALMNVNGANQGEITLNISAVEKQTAGELAAKSFVSGFYHITDSTTLAGHALNKMGPDFFAQIQNSFEDMVKKGREMIVDLNLSESVTEWDFDQDSPATGDVFKDVLDEWLRNNSFQGVYDMSMSTDKYISIRLNIPLWNVEKNRSYSLSNFQSDLRRFFKSQLGDEYKPGITAMGQKCVVVIE